MIFGWRKFTTRILACFIAIIWVGAGARFGAADELPRTAIVAAVRGEDCALFRELALRLKQEQKLNRDRKQDVISDGKSKWLALEKCAVKQGQRTRFNEHHPEVAAELCPDAYQAWLRPIVRREILRRDELTDQTLLGKIEGRLQASCSFSP